MMEQGRSFSGRERNCCFLNVPGSRFATVSAISGLDYPDDGRAIAVVDWDQDGDLDIWTTNRNAPRLRFMRNDSPRKHHFLLLRLRGNGKTTNRDAIGARIEFVAEGLDGKRLVRTLRAGEGFLSQSSKWVHFGLGELDQVGKIIVRWPGDKVETFEGIKVDCRYQLDQGTGQARQLEATPRTLRLKPSVQPSETAVTAMRVPLVTRLPMPRQVVYSDFDGTDRTLRFDNAGNPTLIVLWASWCGPCRKELTDLVNRGEELRAAGIDVVALAVDGIGADSTDPAAAKLFCEQLKAPFSTGRAHADFVQLMTGYHHMLVALKKLLPVPSSFLIDRDGRLAVIYKGPVDIDQLLDDARNESETIRERSERAAGLPGRMIDHDGLFHSLKRTEANTLCAMAIAFASGGRFEDSIPLFRTALASEPDFGEAHQGLAQALNSTNQHAAAAVHYQRALQYFPERDYLHYGLGNVWARQQKWQDALSCYGQAIRINPDHWEARVNRGNVLMSLNRNDEAADDFRQALRVNPSFAPARQALNRIETNNRP
jgi:tetratricopeptide (TPR) repeat protein